MTIKRIAAVFMNDLGDILPYTVASTKEQCYEKCEGIFAIGVDKAIELGGKVVQCYIVVEEDLNEH